MTAETGEAERAYWVANLDEVAAFEPKLVVAGHKKVENNNDPKIIGESQQYLRDFSRVVTEETTAAGIVARMVERYPDWGNLHTLWHSAKTAVERGAGWFCSPCPCRDVRPICRDVRCAHEGAGGLVVNCANRSTGASAPVAERGPRSRGRTGPRRAVRRAPRPRPGPPLVHLVFNFCAQPRPWVLKVMDGEA
jgi:hypothetical protein